MVRDRPVHKGDMGSDAYREALKVLSEDGAARVRSLEALESSGGFRILQERAQKDADLALRELVDADPTNAAVMAALIRRIAFAESLESVVMEAINAEIAAGQAEAAERELRERREEQLRRAKVVDQFA